MSYMTGTGNYQTMYAGICALLALDPTRLSPPRGRHAERRHLHRLARSRHVVGQPRRARRRNPGPTVTGGAANGWPTSFQNRVTDMTASDTVLTAKANVRRDRA